MRRRTNTKAIVAFVLLIVTLGNVLLQLFDKAESIGLNLKYRKKYSELIPGKYFKTIKKDLCCKNVYMRMKEVKPATKWPPPEWPPEDMIDEYTQGGEMPIKEKAYYRKKYAGNENGSMWPNHFFKVLKKMHLEHKQIGWYSLLEEDNINLSLVKYPVDNMNGAVIGSERPWVEAIVSLHNPATITTIEYLKIRSKIPNVTCITPFEFAEATLQNRILYDFVITYSSLEHSGLGRYGDPLNPRGDIDAMEEIWCMLKPGGILYLGLPYANSSYIRWNADRRYGPERMRLMGANYEQLDFFGNLWNSQGLFVLKKIGEEKCPFE